MLTKTVTTGTANDGETDTLTATFPSGPGLQAPPALTLPYSSTSHPPVPVLRTCPVAGYSDLSAGTIRVGAVKTNVSATAQPINPVGGATYQQVLPAGFIAPGLYSITAAGGPVTLQAGLNIHSPIQIQTPFPPGTTISSSQPLTFKWTGGVPGDIVKVSATAGRGFNRQTVYAYVDASAGSYTLYGDCVGYPTYNCWLGIGADNNGEVSIELSGAPVSVPARGITGSVRLSWTYRFVFGGIVLTD
jgi:hypothetical protein